MTLTHERTSEFLEGARRARRQIITPEGVPTAGRSCRLRRAGDRIHHRFVHLARSRRSRSYIPIIWVDRCERRQPDRDLDRAVHRLPRPQPVFRLFRAGMAGLDSRQAPGRAARDRPRRRSVAALRRRRAQPHARGRDVSSAGSAHDLGEGGRRGGGLGEPRGWRVALVLRSAAVHQPRPHARR